MDLVVQSTVYYEVFYWQLRKVPKGASTALFKMPWKPLKEIFQVSFQTPLDPFSFTTKMAASLTDGRQQLLLCLGTRSRTPVTLRVYKFALEGEVEQRQTPASQTSPVAGSCVKAFKHLLTTSLTVDSMKHYINTCHFPSTKPSPFQAEDSYSIQSFITQKLFQICSRSWTPLAPFFLLAQQTLCNLSPVLQGCLVPPDPPLQ